MYLAGILKYLLSSLIGSQIWLIPLVDDWQCGYITKLQKKKTQISRAEMFQVIEIPVRLI
jgi:hypothetical protein